MGSSTNMSDDEWQDEDALEVPKYIAVARVLDDFIPETNDHLTLIRDDLVYVFKKDVPGKPGWWEGETNNVYGIFPSRYVKEVEKKLSQEEKEEGLASCSAGALEIHAS